MKNIVLGIYGFFIVIYTLFVGLDIYAIQVQKQEWNLKLARAMKHVFEEYEAGEESFGAQQLQRELLEEGSGSVSIFIQKLDLEKGILSVKISEKISLLTKGEKEIQCEKILIQEKVVPENHFMEELDRDFKGGRED